MALFYLTEVVWPAGDEMSGPPLTLKLVAQCATMADCDKQAEHRAKRFHENGFDSSRDAWWGQTGDRIHYFYRSTSRPGRFWNGMKPGLKPENERAAMEELAGASTSDREDTGRVADDNPVDRESEDLPPIPGA
jgi:hypothetical protein